MKKDHGRAFRETADSLLCHGKVGSVLPVCNFISAYVEAVIDLQRNLCEMRA